MYKEFFGLDDYPFTLTPDPRFIVFTPSYNEVLASLYYGLENAKGLIVMTGEVGTGKTTALRWILRRLDSSVLAAYVFNPRLSIDDFYHHVTQMLGIKEWSNKSELLNTLGRVLEERHRRGLRTVIIIDEAHELSDYVLEEIRLLLNFESDNAKHLQIVLTGQTELREKLNQNNLRQLKQRVALRCAMHAFPNVDEVDRYITERLLIAGSDQPNVFTPGAVDYIYRCSEGIPRQINNLCDNAMLAAYSAGEQVISRQVIETVAENLDMLPSKEAVGEASTFSSAPFAPVIRPEAESELLSPFEGKTVTNGANGTGSAPKNEALYAEESVSHELGTPGNMDLTLAADSTARPSAYRNGEGSNRTGDRERSEMIDGNLSDLHLLPYQLAVSNGTAAAITDAPYFNPGNKTVFENGNRSWYEERKLTSEETVIEESESGSEAESSLEIGSSSAAKSSSEAELSSDPESDLEYESSSQSAAIHEPESFEDTNLLTTTVSASETDKYTAALERLTAWASERDLSSASDSDENSGVDSKLWEKNGVGTSQNGSTNGYGNGDSGCSANTRVTETDDVSLELEELAGPDPLDQ